jgi:hypothetical protein
VGKRTATVSWTSGESSWQYVCLPKATSLTEDLWTSNKVDTNSKTVNLTGLTPETTYTFYVVSKGVNGGTSTIASMDFTTDCGEKPTTWSYGFEDCTDKVIPNCWTELKNGGNGYVQTSTQSKKTGTYSLHLAGGNSNDEAIAVFPEFEEGIKHLILNFYYRTYPYDASYGQLQPGYVTDLNDAGSFVAVGEPLTQSTSYVHATDIRMPYAPAGAYLAILYTGGTLNGDAYIDDISVSRVQSETFADETNVDNVTRLAGLLGQTRDIVLERPLVRTGEYASISLPFDLSAEQLAQADCPLHGFTIREYLRSEVTTNDVGIYLQTVNSITAGKAYFVRHNGNAENLSPLTFYNVTVSASTPRSQTDEHLTIHGLFNPLSVTANDKSILFLYANNNLYYPNADGHIKGFRMYIKIDGSSPLSAPIHKGLPIRINEQGSPMELEQTAAETTDVTKRLENGHVVIIRNGYKYNLQGQIIP